MELTVEPRRLLQLFRNALPRKTQVCCPVNFTSALTAKINYELPSSPEMNTNRGIFIFAKYETDYFREIQSEDECVVIYPKMIDELRFSFGDSEFITMRTDSKAIHFESQEKDDHIVMFPMPVKDEFKKLFFDLQMEDEGLMPVSNGKVFSSRIKALLAQELLTTGLPKAKSNDEIMFDWDGKIFRMHLFGEAGALRRILAPKKYSLEGEPFYAKFARDKFQDIVKQFCGEVWLSMSERGLIISTSNSDYHLSYLLVADEGEVTA
jgi:hypothetical protein